MYTRYFNIEYARTECDSSEENQFDLCAKTNLLKHKTQLCKTYSELGFCNYGQKCRFAHGKHELVFMPINPDLRKRKCNGFWGKGSCCYGVRCQFGHGQEMPDDRWTLKQAHGLIQSSKEESSKLMRMLERF